MSIKRAILCVDDEQVILNSIKDQLMDHLQDDYLYEFADNADEALEIIEELDDENIDVLIIVSDWLMPGMKGDEFLINVHKKFPKTVKVMLTGQADADAIERVRKEANLYRLLRKPWTEEELIDTVKSGLTLNELP